AKVIAAARARFLEKPVLALPASPDVNYSFDPNQVTAIDDNLSVFGGNVQVMDAWGILSTTGGVLIVREQGHIALVQVRATADASTLSGEGWKLDLKPGWKIVTGPRPGDYLAQKP